MIRSNTQALISLLFLWLFACYQARAGEACESAGTSADATKCAYQRFEAAEANLNVTYKRLLQKLDEIVKSEPEPDRFMELKPKLITAQKAWLAFREKECRAVEVWYTNGTLRDALYFECMEALAKERTKVLSSFTKYHT